MPRPKKSASEKKKRTYKKKTSKPKRKYTYKSKYAKGYTKSKDPAYAASDRKGANKSSVIPKVGHFRETVPSGAPSKNHWRALVMAPAHFMTLMQKFPQLGKYSQGRIPDFQVGDSVLIPAVAKGSVQLVAALGGSATIYIFPSIEHMAESPSGNLFNGGLNNYTANRAFQDVWNAGASARCVAYCVEMVGLDSDTTISGRIGMVNLPADPYGKLPATSIDDLANQPSAVTVKSKDGCNMAWMPDANVTCWHIDPGAAGTTDIYSTAVAHGGYFDEFTWRYQAFIPNGLTTQGDKASTMTITLNPPQSNPVDTMMIAIQGGNKLFQTGTTPVAGPNPGYQVKDVVPCIMAVINGASTTQTSSYLFNVYSHWEVIPNTRGKLSDPGATGQHSSHGTGLLDKAEHIVGTIVGDVEHVVSEGMSVVKTGAGIVGDIVKVGGAIAGAAALIGL